MKDILIKNKYRVERKIVGGCGDVYSGTDIELGEEIAIKLEYVRRDLPILEHESTVYKSLAGGTVLLLADQLIPRVEYLYAKSFVHCDIKPENFLMGTGKLGNVVHIIDFGLAKKYQDPETHMHTAYYGKHKFGGTTRYASVNNHLGIVQTRCDDLESLEYILIYFCRGSLP